MTRQVEPQANIERMSEEEERPTDTTWEK
jgi:hypothetical protein